MFSIKVIICINFFIYFTSGEISDQQYVSMPEVFSMDNYDLCKLLGDHFLYCTFTFELLPENRQNVSDVWEIIKEVSSNPRHYRHDRLRHGICVPETCPNITFENEYQLTQDITACYNKKFSHDGLTGRIYGLNCSTKKSNYPIDNYDIIVAIFISFYILLVLFASFYEGLARYKPKESYEKITGSAFGQIISCFSIPKNWYRLTSTNNSPDFNKLRCIQGIRFFNMLCVIMVHTIMLFLSSPISNTKFPENMLNSVLNKMLANGGYAVQTFFVISAWLLSYHFFVMFDGKKKFEIKYILLAFVNRYIRLTPTLALVILLQSSWMVHLGDGPFWDKNNGMESRNCRENGWTNLVYLNNYINPQKMCLQQTWYVAADTQLFILSLFVIMLAIKYKSKTKMIFTTAITVGVVVPGLISYIRNYDILIRQYPEPLYELLLNDEQWHIMYSSAYCNIGGYMIGLLFGYLFFVYKDVNVFTKKIYVVLWWFLCYGVCLFIVLIASIMYEPDYTYTKFESALYWSFGKNLFALGIAIGIFGFTQSCGWFTLWLIEWSPIQILGRLTYSVYVVHITIMKTKASLNRQPHYLSEFMIIKEVCADIVLSYLAGTVLCLLIEMPTSALQKLFVPQVKHDRLKCLSEHSLKTLDLTENDNQKSISKV